MDVKFMCIRFSKNDSLLLILCSLFWWIFIQWVLSLTQSGCDIRCEADSLNLDIEVFRYFQIIKRSEYRINSNCSRNPVHIDLIENIFTSKYSTNHCFPNHSLWSDDSIRKKWEVAIRKFTTTRSLWNLGTCSIVTEHMFGKI